MEDSPSPASNVTPGGRVAKTPLRATPPAPMTIAGGTFADRRAGYEARARANNPSLTPLRPTPPPVGGAIPTPGAVTAEGRPAGPAIAPTAPLTDPNAGIDLLAYGKQNNIPRPGGVPADQAAAPAAPPAAPQSEANTPLSGKPDAAPGGTSVPFKSPFAPAGGPVHIGGTGAYARPFSNPASAEIYHNFVNKIFSRQKGQPVARTGLRQSPAAVA